MKIYRMVVAERGCAKPVELIAEMSSDGRAVDFARQRLIDHPRIDAIEVWSGLDRLCRLGRRHVEAAEASSVEFGIVAKDPLRVERDAALGLQVRRDAGPLLDPVRELEDAADLRLQ